MKSNTAYWFRLMRAAYSEPHDPISDKITADQLRDICKGLRFSMPVSSILSVLVLVMQVISGDLGEGIVWFILVNAVNVIRIVDVLKFHRASAAMQADSEYLTRHLTRFKLFAALAGILWAGVAYLAYGFTSPQFAPYLVILAGICAGAVTYGSSYAAVAINFITPPLAVTVICLLMQPDLPRCLLAFAVVLFGIGLTRGALLGQNRFIETSRLKHEAEQTAREMAIMSEEDPLTGLFNRRGLEHAMQHFSPVDAPFLVMLIDLDGFKSVNDTYGHKAGDDLLIAITERIRYIAPEGSILARIGGDEFLLFHPRSADDNLPGPLAKRIIAGIANRYQGLLSVEIGACVGICRLGYLDPVEMLLHADFALYAAKKRGRNEYYLFDEHLQQEWERKMSVERDLRVAIETGQVQTWFQPVVELSTGRTIGFEGLLRWTHPQHGAISPPEIIDIACAIGVVHQLTHSVLSSCCGMIGKLRDRGRADLTVAMNLSPRELVNGQIPHEILSEMDRHGLPSAMLEVEITEEAPFDQRAMNESLGVLSDGGVAIALDDFGTGFATFASLRNGRIDKIKIDKDFVSGIDQSRENQHIVRAIVEIGTALGIKVTAEGVETEAERATLFRLGCNSGQGYLFAPALRAERAIAMLHGGHADQRPGPPAMKRS
ncbi:MAG: EAL domain-containing protein [Rhizobiales bacterium]|nr:EAL domain-containing protein [Hyphomicrobiales bacterium]